MLVLLAYLVPLMLLSDWLLLLTLMSLLLLLPQQKLSLRQVRFPTERMQIFVAEVLVSDNSKLRHAVKPSPAFLLPCPPSHIDHCGTEFVLVLVQRHRSWDMAVDKPEASNIRRVRTGQRSYEIKRNRVKGQQMNSLIKRHQFEIETLARDRMTARVCFKPRDRLHLVTLYHGHCTMVTPPLVNALMINAPLVTAPWSLHHWSLHQWSLHHGHCTNSHCTMVTAPWSMYQAHCTVVTAPWLLRHWSLHHWSLHYGHCINGHCILVTVPWSLYHGHCTSSIEQWLQHRAYWFGVTTSMVTAP